MNQRFTEKTVVKRAKPCNTAVMESIPPSWGLSIRGDKGAGGENVGFGRKECDICSSSASGSGWWGRGLGGMEMFGPHQEEIQLNYTSTECIFNHSASFPDVTVSLCARLWSCHLSLFLSLTACVLPTQLSRPATQCTAPLAGADMMSQVDILQKTQSAHTSHVTILFMCCVCVSIDVCEKACVTHKET